MSDNLNKVVEEQLSKLKVPKMIVWLDKEMKVETTNLTEKTIDEIMVIINNEKIALIQELIDDDTIVYFNDDRDEDGHIFISDLKKCIATLKKGEKL